MDADRDKKCTIHTVSMFTAATVLYQQLTLNQNQKTI